MRCRCAQRRISATRAVGGGAYAEPRALGPDARVILAPCLRCRSVHEPAAAQQPWRMLGLPGKFLGFSLFDRNKIHWRITCMQIWEYLNATRSSILTVEPGQKKTERTLLQRRLAPRPSVGRSPWGCLEGAFYRRPVAVTARPIGSGQRAWRPGLRRRHPPDRSFGGGNKLAGRLLSRAEDPRSGPLTPRCACASTRQPATRVRPPGSW